MKIFVSGIVLAGIIVLVSGESGCLCGSFGEGRDGCYEPGDSGRGVGMRGQRPPRPSFQAPVAVINEAHRQRELTKAIERSKVVTVGGKTVSGCGGSQAYERRNDEFSKSAVNDLLRLGSDAAIAPRFSAIGRDPCFGGAKTSSYSLEGSRQPSNLVVVPAHPGLPQCLTCGGSTSNEEHSKSRFGFTGGLSSSTIFPIRQPSFGPGSSKDGKATRKENEASTEGGLIGFGTPGRPSSSTAFGFGRSFSGYTGNGMFGAIPNGNYGSTTTSRFLSALGSSHATSSSADINDFDVEGEGPTLSFEEQEKIYNKQSTVPLVPADPVSVALAYKKLLEPLQSLARGEGLAPGKQKTNAESLLAFGPMGIPKDGRVKHVESDIPEERMSTVDKPIVELKPQAIAASRTVDGSSCDESEAALAQHEAMEREREALENAECNSNHKAPTLVSYMNLGYGPVASNRNTFVARSSVNSLSRSNVLTEGGSGVFGGSSAFGGSVPSDVGMIESGKISYSSGNIVSGDDDIPCGPVGPSRPDYRPGNVHFEETIPSVPQYAEANSRVAVAEAEAEAEVGEAAASTDSDEDDVPTDCGSSIPEGRSYGGGELRGRLSKMWTTIPARVTDNCHHF